jgi:hypothetical protein
MSDSRQLSTIVFLRVHYPYTFREKFVQINSLREGGGWRAAVVSQTVTSLECTVDTVVHPLGRDWWQELSHGINLKLERGESTAGDK